MGLRSFLDERGPAWEELDQLLSRAGRRPERLGADGVRRLGALYRAAAADLAYARRRFPGDPAVVRLEARVGRARHLVYATRRPRLAPLSLLARGYWRLVAARPVPLALAALLLFGPAVLACIWALRDPAAATGLLPDSYQGVVEARPDGSDLGLSVAESSAFSSSIFTNNIRVTIIAFAGGIVFGLGTIYALVSNGVLFGAIAGLAWGAGNGSSLTSLVAAHGFLELTCITVAGAAGLRLGWAIVEGGLRPRGDALVEEARASVLMVLGTAPWLVLAGLVEGFVTPEGLPPAGAIAVGLVVAAPYWGLLAWRGFAGGPDAGVAVPSHPRTAAAARP